MFADVGAVWRGRGESYLTMAGFEIGGIVGERAASAGLLLQLLRKEIVVCPRAMLPYKIRLIFCYERYELDKLYLSNSINCVKE